MPIPTHIPGLQSDALPTEISDSYFTHEISVAYRRMSDAMNRLESAISVILEGGAVNEHLLGALRSDFAAKCTTYQMLSSRDTENGAHKSAEPQIDELQALPRSAQAPGGSRLYQFKRQGTVEFPEKLL